jgi:hypothetical protein
MQQFVKFSTWSLCTAQHDSGVLTPILRSSTIAVAASGFTIESGDNNAVHRGRAGRPDHDQQHWFEYWACYLVGTVKLSSSPNNSNVGKLHFLLYLWQPVFFKFVTLLWHSSRQILSIFYVLSEWHVSEHILNVLQRSNNQAVAKSSHNISYTMHLDKFY